MRNLQKNPEIIWQLPISRQFHSILPDLTPFVEKKFSDTKAFSRKLGKYKLTKSSVLIAYLYFFYSHGREEEETGGR